MKILCLIGLHQFYEKSKHAVTLMTPGDPLPAGHETTFLFRCRGCGTYKTLTVQGLFGDDDDDDGGDAPPEPVLSPDDFYDAIDRG